MEEGGKEKPYWFVRPSSHGGASHDSPSIQPPGEIMPELGLERVLTFDAHTELSAGRYLT